MTRDDALKQKHAAIEILRFLSTCESAAFHTLVRELPQYDRNSILRGIMLANSTGGVVLSVEKKWFGGLDNFFVGLLYDRKDAVEALIQKQINNLRNDMVEHSRTNVFDLQNAC
jgi:hypothetical protein